MPFRKKTVRRAGRLRSGSAPLFPGYIFVKISPEGQEWRSINSTYGVYKLVALSRETPTNVPPDLMQELFDRCNGENWNTVSDDIVPGNDVRIVQGPFADMIARIETLPEKDRVFLLLDFMGRPTRITVGLNDLEPL